ncbi:MAG: hypothetical protein QM767_11975 [Anaeromyxobacter sp.]
MRGIPSRTVKVIVALAVAAAVVYWGWRFLRVDRCLDGGGAWDSRNSVCDREAEP